MDCFCQIGVSFIDVSLHGNSYLYLNLNIKWYLIRLFSKSIVKRFDHQSIYQMSVSPHAIRLKLILINSSLIFRYSFRFMENCLNVPTYLFSNFFLTVSNAAAVFTNFQSPLSPYMLNFNFCSSLCLGVFGIFGAHAIETAFKLVNVALSPSIALPLLYYSSSS